MTFAGRSLCTKRSITLCAILCEPQCWRLGLENSPLEISSKSSIVKIRENMFNVEILTGFPIFLGISKDFSFLTEQCWKVSLRFNRRPMAALKWKCFPVVHAKLRHLKGRILKRPSELVPTWTMSSSAILCGDSDY